MRVITIDGPAGAGKTTMAKHLADTIPGFCYLDTGAVYRTLAYALDEAGFTPGDMKSNRFACLDVIDKCQMGIRYTPSGKTKRQDMLLGGTCIPDVYLRTPGISELSSACSEDPLVRSTANRAIRNAVSGLDIIADGRDCGTAMFPDAVLKFYLWAGQKTRALRRQMQDAFRNPKAPIRELHVIEKEIQSRDFRDANRENDPLAIPGDSIWIDTSGLSENQVKDLIAGIASVRFDKNSRPVV